MRKFVNIINQLPKWYGIGIVLLYSLLIAEFYSIVIHLTVNNDLIKNNLFIAFSRISYGVTVLSGIVIWLISNFLFHLTALLFNGHAQFKRFLISSSYLYIIPAIMILIGIFLLDGIHINNTVHAVEELMNNPSFKLAINLINISFIPYYAIVGIFIYYIYKIKLLYAILSVVIPIASIWGITLIVTWLL